MAKSLIKIFKVNKSHNSSNFILNPDQIYLRTDWYLTYVKNLSSLLKIKYNLNGNIDLSIFERMTQYCEKHKISMKGIIEYEIKRKLDIPVLEIPIFQRPEHRVFLNLDETDYEHVALSAKNWAIAYAFEFYNVLPQREIKSSSSYLLLID